MRNLLLLTVCALAACQSKPVQTPQSFDDLLAITDMGQAQICTLPLAELRKGLSTDELEAAKAAAFDYTVATEKYADEPAAQIRAIFRRAALKRRLNVEGDDTDIAKAFYETLDDGEGTPVTLKGFHDGFHYWMERIGEQSEYGKSDSAAFNLRFCVMNEKRAELHAASRRDILARIKAGVSLPAPELIENINHESSFDDGFKAAMLTKVFSGENAEKLTPLERAQMRGREPILPFDPKTSEAFWTKRDEEILAMIDFIQSHNFSIPADKLGHMTDIDQSLRMLWVGSGAETHFENPEEHAAFKKEIGARIIKIDNFNTAELQNMLSGRGWFRDDEDGDGAGNDAWLIAQHADRNPDFQIEALGLIEAELGAPGISKSNYAYLFDRVKIRYTDGIDTQKSAQRYGTQGRCSGPGTWEPFPVQDPDRIDEIRAEVGLGTMAEYKSRFKDMCKEDQR